MLGKDKGMNKIFYCFKRFILSAFILYGYNLFSVNFNMIIPINFVTLGMIFLLGAPGLVTLVLFKIILL